MMQRECSEEKGCATEGHKQQVVKQLGTIFPHGHKAFLPMCVAEAELHSNKNHDYAHGGDPLGNFVRVSKILELYPDFPSNTPSGVAIIYALKQLDAVMWGKARGIEHKVEGLTPRYQDISVYMKLASIIDSNSGLAF